MKKENQKSKPKTDTKSTDYVAEMYDMTEALVKRFVSDIRDQKRPKKDCVEALMKILYYGVGGVIAAMVEEGMISNVIVGGDGRNLDLEGGCCTCEKAKKNSPKRK